MSAAVRRRRLTFTQPQAFPVPHDSNDRANESHRSHCYKLAFTSFLLFILVVVSNNRTLAQQLIVPRPQIIRDLATPGQVSTVLWSADGTKLAASSLGSGPSELKNSSFFGSVITIWNADGEIFRKVARAQPFFEVGETFAFVTGDKQLVTPPSITSNTLAFSVLNVDRNNIVQEISGANPDKPRNVNAARSLVASPDQSVLAATFGRALPQPVALFSAHDWTKIADLPEGPKTVPEEPEALAFSSDGKFLAVGTVNSTLLLYDLRSNRLVWRINSAPAMLGVTSAVAYSLDGRMIAIASSSLGDGPRSIPDATAEVVGHKTMVRVFNAADGSHVPVNGGPLSPVHGLAWSADGQFLTFITDFRTLHFWDPFRPEPNDQTINLSAGPSSLCLAVAPDGRKLAVGVGQNVRIFSIAR
jgi:WD40 repeat protein